MSISNSFLGTGWAFPIQFNKLTGTVEMLSDEDDIQNIQVTAISRLH